MTPADAAHVDARQVLVDSEQLRRPVPGCRGTWSVHLLRDDFHTYVDIGLDAEHQDLGRFHAEVTDVEGVLADETSVRSSTSVMVISSS